MNVTLAFAAPGGIWQQVLDVPEGTTAGQALLRSDFARRFPEYTDHPLPLGVYGERCAAGRVLQEADRVELYRPLVFDPLESRRRRVAHRKPAVGAKRPKLQAGAAAVGPGAARSAAGGDSGMNDAVLFRKIPVRGGFCLGLATLNRPQTLNGLSLVMCTQLQMRLDAWARDASVVAVVLCGAGGKAFCAGGDLQALYHALPENPSGDAWANPQARAFFATEYRLDFSIHRYPKPIVCWAGGIVMGGGVGLMLGASHRVVTSTTRLAMPEITIGLFPDTAGTWMFSRLPRGIGMFLALTGARLGAADCVQLGLADWECAPQGFDDLMAALADADWRADAALDTVRVDEALRACAVAASQTGALQRHFHAIRQTCSGSMLEGIAHGIAGWQGDADPWLASAAATFLAGSPGTARLAFELQRRARHQSLAEVLRMEYVAALHCCAEPDLREGIRALLIDKDKSPRWRPATLQAASPRWVQRFFAAPWPAGQAHPLADLGA